MTFIEAAIHVLKLHNNAPMSPKELWDEIAKQNLVATHGKTPWATLDTRLRLTMRDSKIKRRSPNEPTYFEAVGSPAKFKLVNYAPTPNPTPLSVASQVLVAPDYYEDVEVLHQITDQSLDWKTLSIISDDGSISYEVANCKEYTYLIEDAAHAAIKIGKTQGSPPTRLQQLRTANPQLTIKHVFPASLYSESELHAKFDDSKKDLEWFFHTKSLDAFLISEKEKHAKVLKAYDQSVELASLEKAMLAVIK